MDKMRLTAQSTVYGPLITTWTHELAQFEEEFDNQHNTAKLENYRKWF